MRLRFGSGGVIFITGTPGELARRNFRQILRDLTFKLEGYFKPKFILLNWVPELPAQLLEAPRLGLADALELDVLGLRDGAVVARHDAVVSLKRNRNIVSRIQLSRTRFFG